MPRIRLILEDDQGNPIPDADCQQVYQLQGDCQTLDRIEHAVEGFKKQALPEVERSLLQRAQRCFVELEGGNPGPPSPSA